MKCIHFHRLAYIPYCLMLYYIDMFMLVCVLYFLTFMAFCMVFAMYFCCLFA